LVHHGQEKLSEEEVDETFIGRKETGEE